MSYTRWKFRTWSFLVAVGLSFHFIEMNVSQAAGKKPILKSNGKLVVQLNPIEEVFIEMPDGSTRNIGHDLESHMNTVLTKSGQYIVIQPNLQKPIAELQDSRLSSANSKDESADPVWNGSVTPSATLSVKVTAVEFYTGSGGDRTYYGFSSDSKSPYNDGTGKKLNEFPLTRAGYTTPKTSSYFENTFRVRGNSVFNSATGLDLGDGFEINILFAWLKLKYAKYKAVLNVQLQTVLASDSESNSQNISVKGGGFFFDISGAYLGYSAGIGFSRTDAMAKALAKATKAIDSKTFERLSQPIGKRALLDGIMRDGTLLLGTGSNAGLESSMKFKLLRNESVQVEIIRSVNSGSLARLSMGTTSDIQIGDLFEEVTTEAQPAPIAGTLSTGEIEATKNQLAASSPFANTVSKSNTVEITLPDDVIEMSKPPTNIVIPDPTEKIPFLSTIADSALILYRMYRYFQYDRPLAKLPDIALFGLSPYNAWGFAKRYLKDNEPKNYGLSTLPTKFPSSSELKPLQVAIIDTGVDYNHPVIHSNYIGGFDTFSNDKNAHDDAYHGTELASIILKIDPRAIISAYKAFNPYGITTSGAIYRSFELAVKNHADVILAAWSTEVESEAIRDGIALAESNGILVITSSGEVKRNLDETPVYPASFRNHFSNLIVVGGLDYYMNIYKQSGYSSNLVDLLGPSESVRTAKPRGVRARSSGTSYAAAFVAGLISRVQNDRVAASQPTLRTREDVIDAIRCGRTVSDENLPIACLK